MEEMLKLCRLEKSLRKIVRISIIILFLLILITVIIGVIAERKVFEKFVFAVFMSLALMMYIIAYHNTVCQKTNNAVVFCLKAVVNHELKESGRMVLEITTKSDEVTSIYDIILSDDVDSDKATELSIRLEYFKKELADALDKRIIICFNGKNSI